MNTKNGKTRYTLALLREVVARNWPDLVVDREGLHRVEDGSATRIVCLEWESGDWANPNLRLARIRAARLPTWIEATPSAVNVAVKAALNPKPPPYQSAPNQNGPMVSLTALVQADMATSFRAKAAERDTPIGHVVREALEAPAELEATILRLGLEAALAEAIRTGGPLTSLARTIQIAMGKEMDHE